ncbi:MAG: DUF4258 domain-containing protein [Nitrospirota bacterium]
MDLDTLRNHIRRGAFFVTDHAITEGVKDGITVADMIRVIETGKIIERYPERHRCLIYGRSNDGLPIHVVIDYRARRSVDIVTTYVPQREQWIRNRVRKRKKR